MRTLRIAPVIGTCALAALAVAAALTGALAEERVRPHPRRARRALLREVLRELPRCPGARRRTGLQSAARPARGSDPHRRAARRALSGRGDRAEDRRPLRDGGARLARDAHLGEVFSQGIPESDSAESIARGKVLVLVEYLKSIQIPPLAAEASTTH